MQHSITPDNLHSFCRTCLNELQEPLMYNIQAMDVQIRQWLEDNQSPLPDDNYPTFICPLCHNKLECFLEFHRMCSRSRKVFQYILEKTSKSSQTWDSNEMSVGNTPDNEADEMHINCDWLDFDFAALPKTIADLQLNVVKKRATEKDKPTTTQLSHDHIFPKTKDSSDVSSDSDEDECSRLHGTNTTADDTQEDVSINNKLACDDPTTPTLECISDKLKDLRTNKIKFTVTKLKPKKISRKHKRISMDQHSTTQHVCEECGKVFGKYKQLEKHQYAHKPPEDHPLYCLECNKIYKSQQTFKEHQLRHSGIKNFECPYCGVKKTTKNELQTHLNYHTKERQYLCPNCPMIFSRISNFRRHDEVVHQGIRRYVCRYCDQAFGKPNTLKHHEMIHTGEKPHECSECGKRFRQQVQLTTHMKVHNKQLNQQRLPSDLESAKVHIKS